MSKRERRKLYASAVDRKSKFEARGKEAMGKSTCERNIVHADLYRRIISGAFLER